MEYPPRDDEDIFNRRYIGALVVLALSLAFAAGLIYLLAFFGFIPTTINTLNEVSLLADLQQAKARTMFISIIVISESLVVLMLRRLNKPVHRSIKEDWRWVVILLVIIVPILHIFIMYSGWLQDIVLIFFDDPYVFMPLGFTDWLIVIGAIAIPLTAIEIYKWIVRRKNKYF